MDQSRIVHGICLPNLNPVEHSVFVGKRLMTKCGRLDITGTRSGQSNVPLLVGDRDLEQLLEFVRLHAAGPLEGVFGPRSITWRISRESALFLGAGRALYLQLAHPWVASAVAQHPDGLTDPIGRFQRTFRIVFTLVFGTLDQAFDTARHLHRRHSVVRGVLPATSGVFSGGSPYWANEVAALSWVYATLTETALLVHDLILPPLTERERELYYEESKILAALFGIPSSFLPHDWKAFEVYNQAMWRSRMLRVGPEAKAVSHSLFTGTRTWLGVPRWYRAMTAQLLPEEVRNAYGLSFGEAEHKMAAVAVAWTRGIYRSLPKSLRYVGPYQEAMARLSGREEADWRTRALNRAWIGQSHLDAKGSGRSVAYDS